MQSRDRVGLNGDRLLAGTWIPTAPTPTLISSITWPCFAALRRSRSKSWFLRGHGAVKQLCCAARFPSASHPTALQIQLENQDDPYPERCTCIPAALNAPFIGSVLSYLGALWQYDAAEEPWPNDLPSNTTQIERPLGRVALGFPAAFATHVWHFEWLARSVSLLRAAGQSSQSGEALHLVQMRGRAIQPQREGATTFMVQDYGLATNSRTEGINCCQSPCCRDSLPT
jgi:hypothetical protein